jgi:hypothetical protein
MKQPKRDAPLFPSPLSQSGFHRCTINDALTALTTQPKSACNTGTVDPFRESVARIARTRAAEAVRIAVLQTTVPESGLAAVGGPPSVMFCERPAASLDSNFLQNFSNRQLCTVRSETEGSVASTDEAVFGRFWVADAEDAAFSPSTDDSDMRLQASPMMP